MQVINFLFIFLTSIKNHIFAIYKAFSISIPYNNIVCENTCPWTDGFHQLWAQRRQEHSHPDEEYKLNNLKLKGV